MVAYTRQEGTDSGTRYEVRDKQHRIHGRLQSFEISKDELRGGDGKFNFGYVECDMPCQTIKCQLSMQLDKLVWALREISVLKGLWSSWELNIICCNTTGKIRV